MSLIQLFRIGFYWTGDGNMNSWPPGNFNQVSYSSSSADWQNCVTVYGANYYSAYGATAWYYWGAPYLINNNTSTSWNYHWIAGYYVNPYHNGKHSPYLF